MPFPKVWLGSVDTDPTNAANWQEISVRNPTYRWTQSPTQTTEYYLELAAGGDPGVPAPAQVLIDDALATAATVGSLAVGEWDYGDNDTLGFDTIYVRIVGDADPDSQVRDYVQFRQLPLAGDSVTLSSQAVNGMAGVDWLAIALAAWFIEPGFTNKPLGDAEKPLRIDPDSFISEGSGSQPWYIDLGTAAITPEIRNCPTPANNVQGLYLTGSALVAVVHDRGRLALAGQPGDVTTVATVIARGGQAALLIGAGVTLTTLRNFAGTTVLRADATTVIVDGGQLTLELAAAIATLLQIRGGAVIDKSTGTHASVVQDEGTYDTMQLPAAKTLTSYQHNGGTFKENVDLLAITTRVEPGYPGIVQRQRVT